MSSELRKAMDRRVRSANDGRTEACSEHCGLPAAGNSSGGPKAGACFHSSLGSLLCELDCDCSFRLPCLSPSFADVLLRGSGLPTPLSILPPYSDLLSRSNNFPLLGDAFTSISSISTGLAKLGLAEIVDALLWLLFSGENISVCSGIGCLCDTTFGW